MAFEMPGELTVSLSVETLASGSPEEMATFGLFSVTANDRLLTAGQDTDSGELRHGPFVAGYPVAEWLVWNWWRIRCEMGRPSNLISRRRWDFAHRISTVGEGFVWPNITLFTDGLQCFLESGPSCESGAPLFRYIGASRRETVPAQELETAIDGFVADIFDKLSDHGIHDTNLHRLWNDLETERRDPEIMLFRRLEAQLGYDPDEADETELCRHLADAKNLGEEALGEIAGDSALRGHRRGRMLSAGEVSDIAQHSGFDADMNDAVAPPDEVDLPRPGNVPAWRVGKSAARNLRHLLDLDGQPIGNVKLSEFAGTTHDAISNTCRKSDAMAFVLDRQGDHARVVLRSKWEAGRRFELARLLGDRVVGRRMNYTGERLFPATRTNSYRQKMQRAFAAEFLSPFAAVEEILDGDYSEEAQNVAAEHFNVSPMTIRMQLVNFGRLDLEDAPDISGRGAE